MSPRLVTFLYETLNFAVLATLLGWFFFRPARQALELYRRRQAEVLENAENIRADTMRLHDEIDQQRAAQRRTGTFADGGTCCRAPSGAAATDRGRYTRHPKTDRCNSSCAAFRGNADSAAWAGGRKCGCKRRGKTTGTGEQPEPGGGPGRFACNELRKIPKASLGSVRIETARPLSSEDLDTIRAVINGIHPGPPYHVNNALGGSPDSDGAGTDRCVVSWAFASRCAGVEKRAQPSGRPRRGRKRTWLTTLQPSRRNCGGRGQTVDLTRAMQPRRRAQCRRRGSVDFRSSGCSLRGTARVRLGAFGMAFELRSDELGAVLLSGGDAVCEGEGVVGTGRLPDLGVGEDTLGRILDPLGNPLDDGTNIQETIRLPLFQPAPEIIERRKVDQTLWTGVMAVDAAIPIGRGQRELIIGDRDIGKTSLAIDFVAAQCSNDVVCVYVVIGQPMSRVLGLRDTLERAGCLSNTALIAAPSSSSPGLQYLAPYAGASVAEYFRDRGGHVLVVYDDLTKHADAYRELVLLLGRPPGREAFPGDIFHVHAELLERAAALSPERGGGSVTAFPLVETSDGDIAAYIPTNLISITDGQIFLEKGRFERDSASGDRYWAERFPYRCRRPTAGYACRFKEFQNRAVANRGAREAFASWARYRHHYASDTQARQYPASLVAPTALVSSQYRPSGDRLDGRRRRLARPVLATASGGCGRHPGRHGARGATRSLRGTGCRQTAVRRLEGETPQPGPASRGHRERDVS